jgi:hypothetical protein
LGGVRKGEDDKFEKGKTIWAELEKGKTMRKGEDDLGGVRKGEDDEFEKGKTI